MNPSSRKNSNYPPMSDSEWAAAPFNQSDPPEKEFNVAVSVSLSKDTTIMSDDYDEVTEDYVKINEPWTQYASREDTVEEIIDFAKHCAEYMLEKKDFSIKSKYGLKQMIDSCKGWTIDEENVEQV